ncbi:MAG TPA: SUMF1/EgtB/PvdO family nonheme iron enzyme [Labilithrix sp.]|nr:SUMF1/EgtB/PvdO family nonheme iron enzyme [Labilithrix sp.]
MGRRATGLMGAFCMLTACGAFERAPLAPYGEAILVVDTDLPVPRVASRLRVDVYTSDGTWIATRDDVRPDPRDWPVSFSVYADDDSRDHILLVRLRAYPDGRQVPYRGFAYAPLPELLREIPGGNGQPRLLVGGGDLTPPLEPDPVVTVDRVVRVTLEAGLRGRVPIVLRGACAGRQARLANVAEAASCSDGDEPLVPLVEAVLEESTATDVPSVAGSYGDEPCPAAAPADARACVPGGAFVLGDAFYRPTTATLVDARPERIVRLTRFAIDRDEVTVGRFRAALARGFAPPLAVGVTERDGAPGGDPAACTFSAAPRGREGYALSCVAWVTARAFCAFEGGALPTEAQWEYAALAARRARKAVFPGGDEPPSCAQAVWGRSLAYAECGDRSAGPVPVDDATADVNALGIRNLAGGLEEHTADSHAAFRDDCWTSAPSVDPSCTLPAPPECLADPTSLECRVGPNWHHSVRGGSWYSSAEDLRGAIRANDATAGSMTTLLGFRCVYPTQ